MNSEDKKRINSYEYHAPNGECWADVRKRAEAFLKEKGEGSKLIFTHGGLICSLTHSLGVEDIITCGSCVALRIDQNGAPKEIVFQWEFPLETVM